MPRSPRAIPLAGLLAALSASGMFEDLPEPTKPELKKPADWNTMSAGAKMLWYEHHVYLAADVLAAVVMQHPGHKNCGEPGCEACETIDKAYAFFA